MVSSGGNPSAAGAADHLGGGPSPATGPSPSSHDVLRGLRCTPSRRSLKFTAGPHARHFLAFDTTISRETRLVFFMELFVFRQLLVDTAVLPAFQVATYTPDELLEVRVVTDPRHPAYGQAGLYAKNTIPHNTIVTPYSGFIEVFATSCNSRTYTMGFGSIGDDYALDAEFVGNYGRYANDPRGVGTLQANLSAENRFNNRGESFTALVARRQISAGEEILMSYGKAHRLSATPWTTMQGEPIMRPRVGGVVPFPSFCTAEAPRADVKPREGEAFSGPMASTTRRSTSDSPPSSSTTLAETCPEKEGLQQDTDSTHNTSAASRLPSVANDLLWECTQCGMWTLIEASLADAPAPCSACRRPKLSGARLVSLLSCPGVTQHALLDEAGLIESHCPPLITNAEMLSTAPQPAPSPPHASSFSSPATSASTTPAAGTAATPLPTAASTAFSCERADWPMNVPFLPWQVWDAAVPLSVLAKHSRFETQEHMFLYTVDTGLGEEKKKRGRDKAAGGDVDDTHERGRRRAEKSSSGRTDGDLHRDDGDSDDPKQDGEAVDEEEGSVHLSTSAAAHHHTIAPTVQTDAVRSSRRNGGGRGCRLKRGVLWERQGDVDPEDLARLHRGLTATPATPLSSSPTADDACDSAHVFSPFTLSPRQLQQDLRMWVNATGGGGIAADATAPSRSDGATSPLSLLMPATEEIDRLIVLRRPLWKNDNNNSSSSGRVPAAAAVSGAADEGFSTQMASVRHRLRCATRRLFTGKSFQAGEVVSYVGGLVRHRGDVRCRVSDSCLEIPLRFFLPPALRKVHRVPPPAGKDEEGGATRRGADSALHHFCQRVDDFSLVVTNEFMYCPCIVWDEVEDSRTASGEEAGAMDAEDEVANALSACNVALVLTLDSLGCPFACAVATKAIGAFEPLLARAQ